MCDQGVKVVRSGDLAGGPGHGALGFVKSEAKKGTDEIGFIPWAGVLRHHHEGKLWVAMREGEYVGFALGGGSKGIGRILQLWVRRDARMVEHGRALADAAEQDARSRGRLLMVARVAADLPAVLFWEAIGYRPKEIAPGGRRRGRIVIEFDRLLINDWRGQTPVIGEHLVVPGRPTN